MTSERRYEQALSARLEDLAAAPPPDYIDAVLEVTANTARRPRWAFPGRWSPVRLPPVAPVLRTIPIRSLVLLALLIVAMAAALITVGSSRRLPSPFGLASNGRIAYDRD